MLRAGTTISALALRPRVSRKASAEARLSPDSTDSTSQLRGFCGMVSISRRQPAWVASVTIFWPAASPVVYSRRT